MPQVTANPSTAQTDTTLVAAPGAGKKIVVYGVYCSSDTAMTVSIESSTDTLKWRQYVAANGGHITSTHPQRALFECAANTLMSYTTSAAGNVFLSVNYAVVDDGITHV